VEIGSFAWTGNRRRNMGNAPPGKKSGKSLTLPPFRSIRDVVIDNLNLRLSLNALLLRRAAVEV
jgi:hypothetical protein